MTAKQIRAEDILRHETPYYRIDTNLVKCDYLSFFETGKPVYQSEYFTHYDQETNMINIEYKYNADENQFITRSAHAWFMMKVR